MLAVPRNKHGDNHSSGFSHDHRSHTTTLATRHPRLTEASTKQTASIPNHSTTWKLHTIIPSTQSRRGTTSSSLHTTGFSDPSHSKSYSESKATATSEVTKEAASPVGSQEGTTTSSTKTTGRFCLTV